jgi:putative polyhydroxyalkanoate system protein
MSQIDIVHAHSMNPAQARIAVQDIADTLARRFGAQYRWDGDVLRFSRSGIDGHIALLPQQLHVTARLGLLFSAMKGPIEHEVRRVLAERFD